MSNCSLLLRRWEAYKQQPDKLFELSVLNDISTAPHHMSNSKAFILPTGAHMQTKVSSLIPAECNKS